MSFWPLCIDSYKLRGFSTIELAAIWRFFFISWFYNCLNTRNTYYTCADWSIWCWFRISSTPLCSTYIQYIQQSVLADWLGSWFSAKGDGRCNTYLRTEEKFFPDWTLNYKKLKFRKHILKDNFCQLSQPKKIEWVIFGLNKYKAQNSHLAFILNKDTFVLIM